MSTPRSCASCAAPMRASDVRCPRCCAFQPRFASGATAPVGGYRETARAATVDVAPAAARSATDRSVAEFADPEREQRGVFDGLFLPDGGGSPTARVADGFATVILLPTLAFATASLLLVELASIVRGRGTFFVRVTSARGFALFLAFGWHFQFWKRFTGYDEGYLHFILLQIVFLILRTALRFADAQLPPAARR